MMPKVQVLVMAAAAATVKPSTAREASATVKPSTAMEASATIVRATGVAR